MIVNGLEKDYDKISIEDLLLEYGLSKELIVVEVNGKIIAREDYSTILNKGDLVELVSFVGGG